MVADRGFPERGKYLRGRQWRVGYNLTPKVLVFAGYDFYNNPTIVGAKAR